MAFYSSSPPPVQLHLASSQPSSPTYHSHIDDASFLSSDLDVSFASISVNSEPSSPTGELLPPTFNNIFFASPSAAMDISPAPKSQVESNPTRRSNGRARSNTVGPTRTSHTKQESLEHRLFGREVSNAPSRSPPSSKSIKIAATPVLSIFEAPASTKSQSGRQRVGLPVTWPPLSGTNGSARVTKRNGTIFAAQPRFDPSSPEVPRCPDAMDLDSPLPKSNNFITSSPPRPEQGSDLGSLFFESNSPPINPSKNSKKRRSCEPDEVDQENIPSTKKKVTSRNRPRSSSPGSSPSKMRAPPPKFDRYATISGQGSLFGTSKTTAASLIPRRPGISCLVPRRPGISALVPPSTMGSSNASPKSAYPGLYGPSGKRQPTTLAMPAPRRAFSALMPPPQLVSKPVLMFDETDDDATEPEDEDGVNGSSPAYNAFKARSHVRAVSYMTAPKSALSGKSMMEKFTEGMAAGSKDISSAGASSFPGHHGTEAHGKILPCHGVKEDGLMRVTASTVRSLLQGQYDDRVTQFHIIDCRFDYEYDGGHIDGAVNLNTNAAVEKYFFEDLGRPKPCNSGDGSLESHTVVIFHCEFSAKRAPTFAKHLRCQDRKMNAEVYPAVHYPEVYILEGGYSGYYNTFPTECTGYVEMDDPKHVRARCEDLNNFRKWERTKSYTYGEQANGAGSIFSKTHTSRPASTSSAPLTTSVTAAATAALGRRAASKLELSVLEEDAGDSSFDQGEGDSPCPPANKGKAFTLKPSAKRFGRLPLERAATFSPMTMLGRC